MVLAAVYGAVTPSSTIPLSFLLTGVAVGLVVMVTRRKASGGEGKTLGDLPHPRGLPLVGNLFQVII